jgi:UDP-N-acetylmuramate dehydrogenase
MKYCQPMTLASIQPNVPLKPYTTFKVGGPARFFASASTPEEFRAALDFARREQLPIFILGGGSNILVSDRGFDGLVIHPALQGIEPEAGEGGMVSLRIQAGETWDEVVGRAAEQELWGIENLSHIPGQAGAALVQNIGAYGQQISGVFEGAEVMDAATGAVRTLRPEDCQLAYRASIFNTTAKGRFIILSLRLRLSALGKPSLAYRDVRDYFSERGIARPSIAEVRRAIIEIRDRKFPFPREEKGGNAGSFFKNLQLGEAEFGALRARLEREFPPTVIERLEEIRQRSASEPVRLPSAFLIEICGLKGLRLGGAEVNRAQPLVLLNRGGATGEDVLALAGHVRRTVYARTGLTLPLEPEPVGFAPEEIERHLRRDG